MLKHCLRFTLCEFLWERFMNFQPDDLHRRKKTFEFIHEQLNFSQTQKIYSPEIVAFSKFRFQFHLTFPSGLNTKILIPFIVCEPFEGCKTY